MCEKPVRVRSFMQEGKWHHIEVEDDVPQNLSTENPQHNGVLQAFADHILSGAPLIADGREGIHGLTLSNAMHLSAWTDQMVEIPFDENLFLEKLNEKRRSSKVKEKVVEDTANLGGECTNFLP